MPTLIQTVNINTNHVEVYDGIAYASVGSSLKAIDLFTGDELDSIPLANRYTTGIAKEGTKLYTIGTSRILEVVDLSGDKMVARDSLSLQKGAGKIFVGDGIAYVLATEDFRGGYSTVDVSNPDDLSLISNPDTGGSNGLPRSAIATNGSGLGLLIGNFRQEIGNLSGTNSLNVLDVSDPENTNAFLNRINLPASPQDLAIASGIAYVADGTSDLQVINYLAFDNQGQAPNVEINTSAIDANPNIEGIQAAEGQNIPVAVDIDDDVQVRNVELLVNNEIVSNDVSYPFDLNCDRTKYYSRIRYG